MATQREVEGGVADTEAEQRISTVRRFNRFYTKQIGLLGEGYLETPFSLTEARVLYELAHRERPSATELARELALDAGYLSRILRGFERRRLLRRTRSKADGRQSHLSLTARGRAAFAPLDVRARGLGIGERLVAECIRFARQAGYRKITLWTNSVLRVARRVYQTAGFRRVHREKHRSFGRDLVGETWELSL